LQQPYVKNPYHFVADELSKRRIVMLGDFQHSCILPYHSLITVLKEWKSKLQSEKLINQNLALVVEKNSKEVALIQKYFETGNLDPVLDYNYSVLSLEDLYFLDKLKEIRKELLTVGCNLKLFGFEDTLDADFIFTRRDRERDLRFVQKRDSLVFEGIKEYIVKNPNDRILVFYGNGHLIGQRVNKMFGTTTLKENESYGYFLAYYLKDLYGNNSVITFNQILLRPSFFDSTKFEGIKNEQFAIQGSDSTLKTPYARCYDWNIIRHEVPSFSHPYGYIFSRTNLDRNLQRWIKYEEKNYNKNDDNIIQNNISESIKLITGKRFTFKGEYKQFLDKNNELCFLRLSTEQLSKDVYGMLTGAPKSMEIRLMLAGMGFGPRVTDTSLLPSKDGWTDHIWPEVITHIKYLNAVGLMWIGTNTEKQVAKKFLRELTLQNFDEPSTYLEMWYKRMNNYSFE